MRPGAHIFEEIVMALTPFTIRIPDATLADLRERLDRVRWPDEIPGAGWQYGTDLTYLRPLVEYWRTQYDWRVHEARLNAFQQFNAWCELTTAMISGRCLRPVE